MMILPICLSFLFCIEFNQTGNSSLACRTEFWVFICAHSAIHCWTVDAFKGIASALINANTMSVGCCRWSRYWCFLLDEVFPFAVEVDQGRNVWFPWFNIVWIHGNLFIFIAIFISKACKAMSKLMNHDRACQSMMSHGKIVGVQNTTSSIMVCVYKNDNMLVGNT